jgi:hypothetical protein
LITAKLPNSGIRDSKVQKSNEGQSLKNIDGLRAAIVEADKYTAGLHPHALTSAIARTREQWTKLDSRFNVGISATENKVAMRFDAKEPVRFTVRFKAKRERLNEIYAGLFGKGVPVALNPGEIEALGSPLMEKAFAEAAFGSRYSTDAVFPSSTTTVRFVS